MLAFGSMGFVAHVVVLLHLLAFAAFVGGGLVQLVDHEPEVSRPMLWGALAGLLTGLALMSLQVLNLGYPSPANWLMLVIKTTVALGVCVLTISNRRFVSIPRGLLLLLVGLGVLEAAIGIWWH